MITAQTSAPSKPPKKKAARTIDESNTAAPRGETGTGPEGIVVMANGKPAEGIQVILAKANDRTQRWAATTDAAGRFRFDGVVPPASYLITAVSGSLRSNPTKLLWPKDSASLRLRLHSISSAEQARKPPPDSH